MRGMTALRWMAVPATVIVALLVTLGMAIPREGTIVKVPAPGHSATWALSAGESSSRTLWLEIDAEAESPLPLVLEIEDSAGRTVWGPVSLEEVGAFPARVGPIASHDLSALRGRVTMPREVGDEAQGQSQAITVRVVGMAIGEEPGSQGDELAQTGLALGGFGVLALLLLIIGLVLAPRRRKGHRNA